MGGDVCLRQVSWLTDWPIMVDGRRPMTTIRADLFRWWAVLPQAGHKRTRSTKSYEPTEYCRSYDWFYRSALPYKRTDTPGRILPSRVKFWHPAKNTNIDNNDNNNINNIKSLLTLLWLVLVVNCWPRCYPCVARVLFLFCLGRCIVFQSSCNLMMMKLRCAMPWAGSGMLYCTLIFG